MDDFWMWLLGVGSFVVGALMALGVIVYVTGRGGRK